MIPTEPIGSIPRPQELIDGMAALGRGEISSDGFQELQDRALRDTIERFEATGSPVISDGEQTKSSFATYPLEGLGNLAPDGAVIPFADGHTRQLPRLTSGPFRFGRHADGYLEAAQRYAHVPVKQAVIAASALSLIYPQDGVEGYGRGRVPGRPRGRLRAGHPAIARPGRAPRADRFHRGPPVDQARSLGRPAPGLRGAQQPRPRALLRRRAGPDRRAHLSRRGPGLHPQRRRRLRRAASRAVRDERRQRLRDARRRAGSRAACSS